MRWETVVGTGIVVIGLAAEAVRRELHGSALIAWCIGWVAAAAVLWWLGMRLGSRFVVRARERGTRHEWTPAVWGGAVGAILGPLIAATFAPGLLMPVLACLLLLSFGAYGQLASYADELQGRGGHV